MNAPHAHRRRTLCLTAVLHAFTHLYQVVLLPLYLLLMRDKTMRIDTPEQATFLVTVLMISYFLPSYPVGVLADRFSKRKLLAFGLALNSGAFVGLSWASTYSEAVLWMICAGLGGSFYHPAATSLIARLYSEAPGRALGLNGMGASVGFFFGPIYAGWRGYADGWRAPVFELGMAGLISALLFYFLAEEEPAHEQSNRARQSTISLFPSQALLFIFLAAAVAFSLRDFTGSCMGSLGSLFLQKAHGLDPQVTGAILSTIFLASAISNPLLGGLSDRGLGRWTTLALGVAAAAVIVFPRVPPEFSVLIFPLYGFFFMASYPMVEGALMNAVPHEVRGRVFGLFITIGGLLGNLAHWAAGAYVKELGTHAAHPSSYFPAYVVMAGFLLLSMLGLPCLKALRRREAAEGQLPAAMLPEQS